MKINKFFSVLALGALCATACEKTPVQELPSEAGFVGSLDVIEINDELFHMDEVRSSYELLEDGTLNISLYEVNFSSRMPYALSVVILPDIPYTRKGNTLTLAGTDIIPLMEMRGELVPYERYLCTDLSGTVNPEKLVLSMKLGGFQTDYSGSYQE